MVTLPALERANVWTVFLNRAIETQAWKRFI